MQKQQFNNCVRLQSGIPTAKAQRSSLLQIKLSFPYLRYYRGNTVVPTAMLVATIYRGSVLCVIWTAHYMLMKQVYIECISRRGTNGRDETMKTKRDETELLAGPWSPI